MCCDVERRQLASAMAARRRRKVLPVAAAATDCPAAGEWERRIQQ
jgi:hypothetical protein